MGENHVLDPTYQYNIGHWNRRNLESRLLMSAVEMLPNRCIYACLSYLSPEIKMTQYAPNIFPCTTISSIAH